MLSLVVCHLSLVFTSVPEPVEVPEVMFRRLGVESFSRLTDVLMSTKYE